MYTSPVGCRYTRHKVLRPPGYDTFHNVDWLRYAYTPDKTTDTYASNNNNFLSTSLFPDWLPAKDSPMLEGLSLPLSLNTLT